MIGEPTHIVASAMELVSTRRIGRKTYRLLAGLVTATKLYVQIGGIQPTATEQQIIGAPGIAIAPIAREQANKRNGSSVPSG